MHIDFEAIFTGAYIEYAESLAEWYCYQWWLFSKVFWLDCFHQRLVVPYRHLQLANNLSSLLISLHSMIYLLLSGLSSISLYTHSAYQTFRH